MKKVIQLISTMNVGGAETMVKDYALLMDKDKVDMKIVSLGPSYDSVNERILKENGIEITYLSEMLYNKHTKLNSFQKIVRYFSRFYYLRKIVKNEKPDIIHAHLYVGWYFRFLPLRKNNIKLYYTVHNIPERFFDLRFGFNEKYISYKEIKRLINRYGLTLIALHDEMRLKLEKLFSTDNIVVINNGIQMERFQRKKYNRESIRASLGIKENEFLIGHVGRYHTQKNHEFIINTFRQVLIEKKDAKLLLVGKGELKEKIIQLVKSYDLSERVIFLENRNDIPELMLAMDVFFFPSRWEGFGNVLIEAQAMGVRCVISDCIPQSVKLTNLVVSLSLEETADRWVECLLKDFPNEDIDMTKLKEYDMKRCAEKLQNLYIGK